MDVLLAPIRPDQAESVTPERLAELLDVARTEYDVVVVDTPPAFTSTTITAIDNAQHAVMVGTLDLPGLKNMKVGLETLDLMGFSREQIVTVLNRSDSKVGLIAHDVKRVLGAAPQLEVPSDRRVPRSLNAARALVVTEPKSPPGEGAAERSATASPTPSQRRGRTRDPMSLTDRLSGGQLRTAPRRLWISSPRCASACTERSSRPSARACSPPRPTRPSSPSSCMPSSMPR